MFECMNVFLVHPVLVNIRILHELSTSMVSWPELACYPAHYSQGIRFGNAEDKMIQIVKINTKKYK